MQLRYRTVFLNIIKRPARAFKTAYAFKLYRYQWWLLALVGIAGGLDKNMTDLADTEANVSMDLASAVFFGAAWGVVWATVFSWVIQTAGKWLDGRADRKDILNVIAYATLPSLLMLVVAPVAIFLLRYNGFVGHIDTPTFSRITQIHHYAHNVTTLYHLVLMVVGVSVVQGFSYKRGFANVFIAALLILIPLGIFFWLSTKGYVPDHIDGRP